MPSSREHQNVIDALLTGAGHTLKICGYLVANLIAFISVLHFLDSTISWLFALVQHPEINFQYLLGLVFYPFAMIIGIPIRDCLLASKLIGIKVSLNEVSCAYEMENMDRAGRVVHRLSRIRSNSTNAPSNDPE